jgi:hypothetical protein
VLRGEVEGLKDGIGQQVSTFTILYILSFSDLFFISVLTAFCLDFFAWCSDFLSGTSAVVAAVKAPNGSVAAAVLSSLAGLCAVPMDCTEWPKKKSWHWWNKTEIKVGQK